MLMARNHGEVTVTFLFSHSRPSSLLYDPNMGFCVLGFVLCSVCVLGCVSPRFSALSMLLKRTFYVVESDV